MSYKQDTQGYRVTRRRNCTGARNAYVFKVVRVRVYTARIRSASGFIFFNDREEYMAVEHLTDVRCEHIGLAEEGGQ